MFRSFSIPIYLTILLSTALHWVLAADSKRDLELFFNNACLTAGAQPFFVCRDVPDGGCCSNPNHPTASAKTTHQDGGSSNTWLTLFAEAECKGQKQVAPPNSCYSAKFAGYSASWSSSEVKRRDLESTEHVKRTCQEPDSAGFVHPVTRETIIVPMPVEKREMLSRAVASGHLETLNAHAPRDLLPYIHVDEL